MAEDNTRSPSGTAPPATRILDQGKRQFIIASRRGSQALSVGLRPMSAGAVRGVVGQIPGLDVIRVLRPRRAASALSVTPDEATEVYVARIDPDRAELIRQTTTPQLIVEEDAPLEYGPPAGLTHRGPNRLASWNVVGGIETRQIRLRVVGEGDRPLTNAGVSLAGQGFPQEGRTDKRGEVALPLVTLPGKRARFLFVSSPTSYWDQYLTEPELSDADVNVVRLRAIGEIITGFPEQFRYGWGQIQMGLDRIPESLTGKGVRIAIVDSGADTSHPLLRHIRLGRDLTNSADPHTWTQDIVGQGSHCAGIIGARDESGKMLRGFAPEAEIHILKVFPGGQFSNLLEAVDYCLEQEVDVLNLGLGSAQRSQAIEQKLEEAALHGIACIVAAGNFGGPVQYPASSPYALAIGAVGRLNEYPDKTWDATTVLPHMVAADGIFLPSFTCVGPEVAICAPGVAIVSTVPGGFEPQSGTSMAATHVSGVAALLLAHHTAFQGPLRARNQQRVAGLFSLIRSMSVPYVFGAGSAGAWLPRLHGLEQLLQPNAEAPGERRGASAGNGQAALAIPVPPPAVSGVLVGAPATRIPAGQPFGGVVGPMAAPLTPAFVPSAFAPSAGSAIISATVVDPHVAALYAQAPLGAQGWSFHALLDSLRRQYGGV
jgi:subtilisin